MIKSWQDPTAITEVLEVSQRFNGELLAIINVKEHRNLLWLLATNGYASGGLLDIPRDVRMKLMKDGDFAHLFLREDDAEIPSRNKIQHVIHQNANLVTQICIHLDWTPSRRTQKN